MLTFFALGVITHFSSILRAQNSTVFVSDVLFPFLYEAAALSLSSVKDKKYCASFSVCGLLVRTQKRTRTCVVHFGVSREECSVTLPDTRPRRA